MDKRFFSIDSDSIVTRAFLSPNLEQLVEDFGGTWYEDTTSDPKRFATIGLKWNQVENVFHEPNPPVENGGYLLDSNGYWRPNIEEPAPTSDILWYSWNTTSQQWEPHDMARLKEQYDNYPTDGKYYEWIEKESIVGSSPQFREVRYSRNSEGGIEREIL